MVASVLSRANSFCRAIHIFDFFAGPGSDLAGEPGSPIRILKTLTKFEALAGWSKVEKNLHFFDESSSKIAVLSKQMRRLETPGHHAGCTFCPIRAGIRRVSWHIKKSKCRKVSLY